MDTKGIFFFFVWKSARLNKTHSPVNSRQWAAFLTINVVKRLSPKMLISHSSTVLLCAEDSSAVLEESQNIIPIHTATNIQQITVLIFSCRIYKTYPSAACMELYTVHTLSLYVIRRFKEYRHNGIIIHNCKLTFSACI